MYQLDKIKTVHLEISTLCNAKCPMCLRNVSGGKTNPLLPLTELHLDQIQNIFTPEVLKGLSRIYLCGNYGDPAAARDTLSAMSYFREKNPALRLEIFSNGSIRSADWWASLARLEVEAHFGVDGLAETNSLYRRGTKFEKVMENAAAFIAAGGRAHWDFIVFRHNEKELSAARELSLEMGFKSFRAKKTGRFFSNAKSTGKERHPVLNDLGEVEYYLELPSSQEYLNPSLLKEDAIVKEFGSFERYLDETAIDCKVEKEKSVYVTAEGLVFPCCWTAIQMYPWYQKPESSQIWDCIKELPLGKKSLSALDYSLSEILAGPFFQKIIPERWEKKTLAQGKLKSCARVCGKSFDPFKDQF